jgi:sensor histidine kinase YesM
MGTELKYQNFILNFLMDKKWRIARHLLLILPLTSNFLNTNEQLVENIPGLKNYAGLEGLLQVLYRTQFAALLLALFIIYLNIYILVPKLLFKNRILAYFFACIGIAVVFYFTSYFVSQYYFKDYADVMPLPKLSVREFIDITLITQIFLGATTGYRLLKKWIIDSRRMNDLANIQLNEELNQLKNQVNPHFLFNTLNNLNTLVLTNPSKASQVVLGLSDVLRYQIYDSSKDKVLLSKDIEMLDHFLMLEKIRRDKFTYEIVVEAAVKGILIPPLLFVNFIDNALKHGADVREPYYLKVNFSIQQNQLIFYAENSKPSLIAAKEAGGVGLKNITRRLDLLYGTNYKLTLDDKPNLYIVHLKIPI